MPVRRFLVVAVSCLVAAVCCSQPPAPRPPLAPQVDGTIAVAGLAGTVRIVRDRHGVPHVYAGSQDDLFFGQGFVQAQDRLFQMDLWRRSAQGRLSEVLGPNFVERDAMTRRVQYRGDPRAEWASYGPDARRIAAAFVRGVNAWVALARERPPEEFVLAGWKPGFWSPDDLINRTDAFAASGDALAEIFAARLIAEAGAARAAAILQPSEPIEMPREIEASSISYVLDEAIRRIGTPPFFVGLAASLPASALRATAGEPAVSGRGNGTGRGSGIGPAPPAPPALPAQTVSQLPLPSPRYLVHLNGAGWNVIGATAPWRPGVEAGHNERVAWKMTPFDADTQDVYVERVNPDNPHEVEHRGAWVATRVSPEVIVIKRRPQPFTFDVEETPHGVVIASDRAHGLAYTLRWSGMEPGASELAALVLDRAQSAADLRAALDAWKMPAVTVSYIDAEARGGSQIAGLMPVRAGGTGALPAPGWTGTYDWTEWRSIDELEGRSLFPSPLARLVRAHRERAEALLHDPAAARAILDEAAAAARDTSPVTFVHPLAITAETRARFNAGPFEPARRSEAFHLTFDPADWDRSTALNAPGQSASPDSGHFSDLAALWAEGRSIPLWFTDRAVQANAANTLTLEPRR